MNRTNTFSRVSRLLTPLATLALLTACSSGDAAGDASSGEAGSLGGTAAAGSGAPEQAAAAPQLTPSASFALADDARVAGVAMSPDGSRIVVMTQARLGEPVTLRAYDATSGAAGASTTLNTVGLWTLHWMADNRLVAADRDARLRWRVWDGSTLEERTAMPQDATCADGVSDRSTGAVYSTNGVSGMGDVICRFDTGDGSIRRTADGLLTTPSGYWVRPGSNEIVVVNARETELLTLDGSTLERKGTAPLADGENVVAVGRRTWMQNQITRASRLEPGAIAVPDLTRLRTSPGGAWFLHANGMDDVVIYAAEDGKPVGTMPAGMNPAGFSDWSLDDKAFVRLTTERVVEIYRF